MMSSVHILVPAITVRSQCWGTAVVFIATAAFALGSAVKGWSIDVVSRLISSSVSAKLLSHSAAVAAHESMRCYKS
eukprot:3002-Heterococcus_DN1.PRE.1